MSEIYECVVELLPANGIWVDTYIPNSLMYVTSLTVAEEPLFVGDSDFEIVLENVNSDANYMINILDEYGCLQQLDFTWDCEEITGCADPIACNFDSTATTDDNSFCEYALDGYDCEGNCLDDIDGDGVCDQNEISGCTDSDALNYSSVATDDDGSCVYPVLGCTDSAAGNYDVDATEGCSDCCDYGPWDVSSTDCNMTVLLPGDLDITVEGEALSGSIWIGVADADGNVNDDSVLSNR